MLQGAAVALFLTAFRLLFGGSRPGINALDLWILSVGVALGGAVGGAAYFGLDAFRARGGWQKILANVLSLLAYAAAAVAFLALGVWLARQA